MAADEPDYVTHWRKFLRYFDIRGALPVTFKVRGDLIEVAMTAPDTRYKFYSVFSKEFEIPPFILSQVEMIRRAQSWAQFLYIHELREQTYLDGVRVDIPDEDH